MKKITKILSLIGAMLCCLMLTTGVVYADTDGTEIQVAQPMTLELQLGPQWAGVQFQLKTDSGVYPGTVVVGEDGVLRTELGVSTSYVLSCLNSTVALPAPNDTEPQAPATDEPTAAPLDQMTEEASSPQTTENPDADSQVTGGELSSEEQSISGIPVKHIILFGGGLVLAIGSLIAIRVVKKNRSSADRKQEDDDDDEDY